MGLVISFSGVAYLVWVLVMGVARGTVNQLSMRAVAWETSVGEFPGVARWFHSAVMHAAPAWDVLGVLWLLVSLVLIVGASRQRWSVSWAWMCSLCQALAAALLAVWSGLAAQAAPPAAEVAEPPAYPATGWAFMSVSVAFALVLWVGVLVWLLYERARLRRGPSLRDGLRTHVPG